MLKNEIDNYNNELEKIHNQFNDLKVFNEIKDRIYEIINESSEKEVSLVSWRDIDSIKKAIHNNNYI